MLFEALSACTTTYFLCIEDEHLFAFLSLNIDFRGAFTHKFSACEFEGIFRKV